MPTSTDISDARRPARPSARFRDLNAGKADFSTAYERPDPRAYAKVLGGLDYRVPAEALPVFRRVIAAQRALLGRSRLRVADVGCSFGVNAALLKHDVSLRSFFARYRTAPLRDMPNGGLLRADREFFAETLDDEDLSFVGMDVSAPAIEYAENVGLLDAGISEDLEKAKPSAAARALLCDVDLVISTGCVGYVSEQTFGRILDCPEDSTPWVASFVLRMFPFDRIAASLGERGYVTEKLHGAVFAQRRVADDTEWQHMLDALQERGITPTEAELAGTFQAEFFLSRPAADARQLPLARLMAHDA